MLECAFQVLPIFVASLKPVANKASQNINFCLKGTHMTNAIINIVREPKPGHYAQVLASVKDLFPSLDRPGNVTSTLAHPK